MIIVFHFQDVCCAIHIVPSHTQPQLQPNLTFLCCVLEIYTSYILPEELKHQVYSGNKLLAICCVLFFSDLVWSRGEWNISNGICLHMKTTLQILSFAHRTLLSAHTQHLIHLTNTTHN